MEADPRIGGDVEVDSRHHEPGEAGESGMAKDVDEPVVHGEPSLDRIVRRRGDHFGSR